MESSSRKKNHAPLIEEFHGTVVEAKEGLGEWH